jgi:hypothetical protein
LCFPCHGERKKMKRGRRWSILRKGPYDISKLCAEKCSN